MDVNFIKDNKITGEEFFKAVSAAAPLIAGLLKFRYHSNIIDKKIVDGILCNSASTQ